MNKEIIKILEANNKLLRESIAMNLKNTELSDNSILQINSNINFIDKLKEIKIPKVEKYNVIPLKCIVDRYERPFSMMTINEIKIHLYSEILNNIDKSFVEYNERIGNYEATLLICNKLK